MQTDLYTKAALGVIAASLVVLAAQGFGVGARGAAAPAAPEPSYAEPYKFLPIPMMRLAFRMDSQTGETWWTALPRGAVWTRIAEPGEAAPAAEPEPAPAARPEAPVIPAPE